ncbi:HAD family hydrolase [Pontibacillus halophilus JSM 076056 = DSM 19796]|uniref:HAD family hydrolase n=1 Tax=Pontibacillus halophilus JSM 076056 = DSM 19796 TaxID=1385510 RepID=A0A0A5GN44_9BACI|nr:HAD family hydrolase [Pontibacillus halophilus]KGX92560.1 HAD family hydrolase [Pontibacillus halophilus JSM 076056 = DSM 19796]
MNKAIFFDLDGTLVDRASSLKKFLENQHKRFPQWFQNVPIDEYYERFIHLEEDDYVWKDKVYQSIEQEYKLPQRSWQKLLSDYVQRFYYDCLPFPDVVETIQYFKDNGYKVGIVTNGRGEFQWRNIHALKLHSLCDTILISELEGYQKPDRHLFEKAMKEVDTMPVNSIFVGDHEDHDIAGAKEVGMSTVLADHLRKNPKTNSDYTIHSLRELQHLFTLAI